MGGSSRRSKSGSSTIPAQKMVVAKARSGAATRPMRRRAGPAELTQPAPLFSTTLFAPPALSSSLAKRQAAAAASGLTHFDRSGAARMVDVGVKAETERLAIASGVIAMEPATAKAIAAGTLGKGDVLAIARIAGITAAKRTSEWIPLCHPLRLTGLELELEVGARQVSIRATVRAFDRSGVEMEALTAVSAAALTIYDMCKAIDRGMILGEIRLEEKRGGKSGVWRRGGR
jgi:cyclic pyranopterin phosphate synthase